MKTRQLAKIMKLGEYSNVGSCLLKWFHQCLDEKTSINGSILREKAEKYRYKLEREYFKTDSRWLTNWKTRNMFFKQICDESDVLKYVIIIIIWIFLMSLM